MGGKVEKDIARPKTERCKRPEEGELKTRSP